MFVLKFLGVFGLTISNVDGFATNAIASSFSHISRKINQHKLFNQPNPIFTNDSSVQKNMQIYPPAPLYYAKYLRILKNRHNVTNNYTIHGYIPLYPATVFDENVNYSNFSNPQPPRRIIINKKSILDLQKALYKEYNKNLQNDDDDEDDNDEIPVNDDDDDDDEPTEPSEKNNDDDDDSFFKHKENLKKKSKNFEVITDYFIKFKDIGGYDNVKSELYQCIDILKNHTKYSNFNVRVPKGLIFEGPPGNGKTLFAKALAGEAGVGFISVSGSQFQDKYVGVGSSRIRELFTLAKKHKPCIIFIDEIDALGRKRSGDGESSSTERDSTLNELLVALDGFQNSSGIFLVGATNRIDLLDPALIRPGRIDKHIFIGNPDTKTRKAILTIHLFNKPHDDSVNIDDLVDFTQGLSGAQIENLLNEAMLNVLRENRNKITTDDIEIIMNKIMSGWQPNEHEFTDNIIDRIAIHEMGHVVLGLLSKYHSKVSKVVINLSSPNSPAYTVFENSLSNIYTREALFEHLMILLAGRIAEEIFFGVSITTGAINDFEEALKLSEKMILYYGMGQKLIYPRNSEKYKQIIDDEVSHLINDAYNLAKFIIQNSKDFIFETSEILKKDKIIRANELFSLIQTKHQHMLNLQISNSKNFFPQNNVVSFLQE
jgi:cell division protease FtsH